MSKIDELLEISKKIDWTPKPVGLLMGDLAYDMLKVKVPVYTGERAKYVQHVFEGHFVSNIDIQVSHSVPVGSVWVRYTNGDMQRII